MQRARGLRTSSFGSNLGATASYHAPLVVSRAPLEKPMREVSAEEREEIEQAFQLFDSNKDGYIDYHEIKVAMRALGFELGKEEVLDAMAAHNVQPHDQMSRDAFVKMSA